MRVLLTGAAGFVGRALVTALARHDAVSAVLATDRAAVFPADGEVEHAALDVTDRAAVAAAFVAFRPDALLHAAALTPSPEVEAAWARHVARVNVEGLFTTLDVATRHPSLRRILLVSSAAVLGPHRGGPPLDESASPAPRPVYAASKLAGETVAFRLGRLREVPVAVIRLAAVYGPGETEGASRPRTSPVHRLLTAARPVTVGGADIERDFVHAEDAAEAAVSLLVGERPAEGVFHCGGGGVIWHRLIAAAEAAGLPVRRSDGAADIVPVIADARPPLDTGRLARLTGWRPRSIEDGVRELLHDVSLASEAR